MSGDRHSRSVMPGSMLDRVRRSALPAGVVLGSLAFGGGAAFGQADQLALSDDTPIDEDAGIRVPEGFDAKVFAEGVGRARHVAVRDNGDVYVALRRPTEASGIAALRDEDGDGAADRIEYFGEHAGTGIAIHGGFLYASSDDAIFRYPLPEGDALLPQSGPETVVEGFPEQRSHASKAFTLDESGNLFVNVGAPSNACQEQDRTRGSPGQEPCPLLENHAGIWRFDADKTGQTFADGERLITGTRNIVALDWNPLVGELYFVMHGRDQLHDLFPDLYTEEESAELPAEELHVVRPGANYGWPYTYWDHHAGARMVAPEYGGNAGTAAQDGDYETPLLTLPAHWAPNDLLFYTGGDAFPEAARGGAFIAFHGSWNRAPLPQGGYNVVFVPFDGAAPTGDWSVFADGFKGAEVLEDEDDAEFRPTGLAQGPDGALYITDSVQGRIWRVTHEG
jgi:glucose/arabinose dehydrogenase